MPKRESEELSEAMAATDRELFAAALGDEPAVHDDSGDTSLEHPDKGLEGDPEDIGEEAELEADAGEEKSEADEKPQRDPKTGQFAKTDDEKAPKVIEPEEQPDKDGRVPSHVVRKKTEQVRAAESREAAANARLEEERNERANLRAQLDAVSREIQTLRQPPQKVEPKADPEPDMFADPDGWRAWNQRQTIAVITAAEERAQARVTEIEHRIIGQSFDAARSADEKSFDAGFNSLMAGVKSGHPEALLVRQRVFASVNPGAELLRWQRGQELLNEFGSDPAAAMQKRIDDALEAKLSDPEFRKKYVAGLKEDANVGGTPRHITRPAFKAIPSLNGSRGAASLTDPALQEIFDDPSDEGAFNRALS